MLYIFTCLHSPSHCSDHLLLLTFSSVAKHIKKKKKLCKLLKRLPNNMFPCFELNILPLALTAVLSLYPFLWDCIFSDKPADCSAGGFAQWFSETTLQPNSLQCWLSLSFDFSVDKIWIFVSVFLFFSVW